MKQYLLLQVTVNNWGLLGPGEWVSNSWSVFSDGSYKLETSFLPDDGFAHPIKLKTKSKSGCFENEQFTQMLAILNEKWIDPSIDSDACDGTAWQIKQFYPSGRTKRSSGKLGYIYGQPIERIAVFFRNGYE